MAKDRNVWGSPTLTVTWMTRHTPTQYSDSEVCRRVLNSQAITARGLPLQSAPQLLTSASNQ